MRRVTRKNKVAAASDIRMQAVKGRGNFPVKLSEREIKSIQNRRARDVAASRKSTRERRR